MIQYRKRELMYTSPPKQQEYASKLQILEQKLTAGEITKDKYSVEKQRLAYRYEQYFNPTDETLLKPILGVYDYKEPRWKFRKDNYIFIPVRNLPDPVFTSGDESLNIENGYPARMPAAEHSFPDPNAFIIMPHDPVYPLAEGDTPGTTLRHELEHAAGVNHPDNDLNTIADLRAAWEEKKQGKIGKYHFVFHTAPFNYIVADIPTAQPA